MNEMKTEVTSATPESPIQERVRPVCCTKLLLDEPESGDDALSGPHERIAQNIVALIRDEEARGVSIGVEGSWGSGKSTVAKLIAKELKNDPNIALILFDAWAHEGDPLRRTFLETAIRRLQVSNGWIIKKRYWQKEIEVLANRREKVTTKETLKITPWGRALVLLLALIPVGGAFVTAALRESVTLAPGAFAWKFIVLLLIGLILIFVPFIVVFSRSGKNADLLSLFFNKGPTQRTTVSRRTVNPTSIEFEERFTKLVDEVLKNNEKQIVIVLDNLDRVEANDALTIWSTLQTFLQHKETQRPDWRDRLWIIVLYDLRNKFVVATCRPARKRS